MKLKYLLISTLAVAISACAPSPKTEDNKPEESEKPSDEPGEDPGEDPGEEPGDNPGEEPSVIRYTKVTEALEDWAGEYIITAETSEGIFVMGEWGDDSYGTSYAVPVGGPENKKDFRADLSEDGTFPAEIMDPYKVTLLHQDSFYTIFFSGFGYLAVEENANQLWKSSTATGDAYLWDPDFDEGEIYVDGISIKENPIECKRRLAYLPDNPDLYDFMSGIKYLNFVADIYEMTVEDRQEQIKKLADMFGITQELAQPISSYSHGMKQKLALISAFMHKPKLVLLDEPFVGLDPIASHRMKEEMREACRQGAAVFFSTHVLEVAEKLCDKIAIIRDGKLIISGNTSEVKGSASLEDVFLQLEEKDD